MNRNRFKSKNLSKSGRLNSSATSNGEANASNLFDATEEEAQPSTASSFRPPEPSPKKSKKNAKRSESNAGPSCYVENITTRKSKKVPIALNDDLNTPIFERLLSRCQFQFNPDGDTPHSLGQEQIFFVRSLEEQINEETTNNAADIFMKRFASLHEDDVRLFKKSLSPTQYSEEGEKQTEQGSLIHLLLELPQLQTKLMNFLFNKLMEYVADESAHLEGLNDKEWSSLILRQMCNLGNLVDSATFTQKLLEIFEIANPPVQKIFLSMLPKIIYDDQQQEVARVLSKTMKQGEELTPQLLDALSSLTTSRDIREFIMENVISMLKSGPRKFLPQVITFLLMETQFADDLPQIVQALRRDVDLNPYGVNATQQAEQASVMVKVVATLRANLNAIGEVSEVWLTVVSATANVTMLDLAVLVLLYNQGDPARCKTILALIRTKSSAGAIKEQTLEQLLTHHGKTLAQNLNSLLDIGSYLLKYPERTASHFGALWYKLTCLHIEDYQRQNVLYKLIMIVGLCSPLATQNALWVLSELVEHHLPVILPQASLLMSSDGLLERVDCVALEHARKIMDVLCKLAYSGHSDAHSLQADINILIRKQLACPQPLTKRKGIVGAVMATKHIATEVEEASPPSRVDSLFETDKTRLSDASSESSLILPSGHKAHQALELINLVRASTSMYPDINGFFYDELASMANQQALDSRFLDWLADEMVIIFQEEFTLEKTAPVENPSEFKLDAQFCLDGDDNPLVTSIADHVINDELKSSGDGNRNSSSVISPYVLCPLFRLVRILKYRTEEGNLDDIDALLGCSLRLPTVLPNLTRGGLLSMSNQMEQKVTIKCLFLAINWLREVVNAFSLLMRNEEITEKVIQRIRHIVWLEGKLAELLAAFPPDFNPPACQFYAEMLPFVRHSQGKSGKGGKKKKQIRKKKKAVESSMHPALDNSDNEDDNDEEDADDEVDGDGQVSDLIPVQAHLREMDMSIFHLLSKDFKINTTPTQAEAVTVELGPAELVFMLEDLCTKVEHSLVAGSANNAAHKGRPAFFQVSGKVGQPISSSSPLHYHVDMFPSEMVVTKMSNLIKHFCNKLQLVMDYFKNLEDRNDGLRDGPGSDTEHSRQLSRCFFLLLRCMKATFAWNGFYTRQYATLFLDTLRELAGRVEDEPDRLLLPEVISAACCYLSGFQDVVMHLPTAVALIALMEVISSHDNDGKSKENPKNKALICKLCKTFLTRDWPNVPRGSPPVGQLVAQLVQSLMDSSETRLIRAVKLLKMIEEANDQLKGKNSSGFIEDMPTITKNTLLPVFQVLGASVLAGAREACSDPDHLTQQLGGTKQTRTVQSWTIVIDSLQKMTSIAKHHESRPILTALFKHCQPVLRLFMDRAMPLLDKALRKNPVEVQTLLKKLQTVTRFLQSVCCQGKVSVALGLVQLVPNMRYLLEKLVQRVKSMLIVNSCTQAFWMGNLKNKNIRGEEIASQMDEDVPGEDEEESEEEAEKRRPPKKKKKNTDEQEAGPSGVTQKSQARPSQASKKGTQKSQKQKKTQKAKLNNTQKSHYKPMSQSM